MQNILCMDVKDLKIQRAIVMPVVVRLFCCSNPKPVGVLLVQETCSGMYEVCV